MSKGMTKVEPEATGVVTTELAALFNAHAGEGLDDMGREDFALPFLKILQALSPELSPAKPKYVDGARPGDFLNSVTNELVKGNVGVFLVRAAFEKKWLEWRPVDAGGGLVRVSDTKEEADANRVPAIGNKDTDTEITETAQIYCLMKTEAGWRPVVLPWTKSKLKAMRNWNGKAAEQTFAKWQVAQSSKTLPIEAVVYRLTTRVETGRKGEYYVPVVEPVELVSEDVFKAAREFRDIVTAGKAKVVYEQVDGDPDVRGADDVPGAEDGIV